MPDVPEVNLISRGKLTVVVDRVPAADADQGPARAPEPPPKEGAP